MDKQTSLDLFRKVAFWEGMSTVVLFCIAMPIKYIGGIPEPVTYVGWAHGLLFMVYLGLLAVATLKLRWKPGRVGLFFLASLVPFAPFFVERSLRGEQVEG